MVNISPQAMLDQRANPYKSCYGANRTKEKSNFFSGLVKGAPRKLLLLLMLLPITAVGQPYWMVPSSFYPAPNTPFVVSWVQGKNFIATPALFRQQQFSNIQLVEAEGEKAVLTLWRNSDKEQLSLTATTKGNLLVVAQTVPEMIELQADTFNAFLKEYGQDEVYFSRQAVGNMDMPARQIQSHHVKLLLQAGDQNSDVGKKTVGLPLEIIPDSNPYQLKAGEMMRFKIYYDGKPLFGARVKVWNRHNNRTTLQNIYSEKNGSIETRISAGGVWMVSVVHLVSSTDKRAAYRSYWSALVFGLK